LESKVFEKFRAVMERKYNRSQAAQRGIQFADFFDI
jgi:hypothetical protein